MIEDKYKGLALAVISSLGMGGSFILTKKGLNNAADEHGFDGDGFVYLKTPLWWAGIISLIIGELANFAAYAFAPAILVTPLGALSVLIGAVLGAYFLDEQLGVLGRLGCATCLLGAIIIVLHAPADQPVESVDEILDFAIQPGFLIYCVISVAITLIMIYKVGPAYGKKNPLIYISICSTMGSISVMAIKGLGIAVKLTFAGNNQFTRPATYAFMVVSGICILAQMIYLNKALAQFPTSIVNPLYYVTFTTATLCASFIMFKGFNTTDAVNILSLLCGFLVIFSGVYLLNLSRADADGQVRTRRSSDLDGIPTDGWASIQTRRSIQGRRSTDPHRRSSSSFKLGDDDNSRERTSLMYHYDDDNDAFGLSDLVADYEETGNAKGNLSRKGSGQLTVYHDRPSHKGAKK